MVNSLFIRYQDKIDTEIKTEIININNSFLIVSTNSSENKSQDKKFTRRNFLKLVGYSLDGFWILKQKKI
jgi:hypothetical protein